MLLPTLLACTPTNLWPEAHDACSTDADACEAVLTEHFGLEVEGEYLAGALAGLTYMVMWELGEDCPDWAPHGENGAACFYNEAAHIIDRTIFDPEKRHYDLSWGTFEVSSDTPYGNPFNYGINISHQMVSYCGAVWIGTQGEPYASEEDWVLFKMASDVRANDCDDPGAGK